MGEIADAMLEGDLCAGCGGFIDGEGGEGFPRYCCDECDPDSPEEKPATVVKRKPRPLHTVAQSITDRAISKVQEAHQEMHGTPLPSSGRKRLYNTMREAIETCLIPSGIEP